VSNAYINYRQLFLDGYYQRYDNPAKATQLMRQASALAKEDGDLHEALFMDHWILQTVIHISKDYVLGLDMAVQTAVEARKPMYKAQMERVCVHEDLIRAYLGIDPIGQAILIEDAMTYIEKEADPSIQCYYCMMSIRASFELTFGATEKAETATLRYFNETASSEPHHYAIAHLRMTELAYLRGDWDKVLSYAERGMTAIGDNDQLQDDLASFSAAKAMALQKLGRDAEADIAAQQAVMKAAKFAYPLSRLYYQSLSTFYLGKGQLDEALALRERQLADIVGKGQPYWEAVIRLECARLSKQLGEPYDEHLISIRTLATKLKLPDIVLDPLSKLETDA
jgi:ATP/maltotriose-dependent transcriptional regulator MalT